MSDTVITAEGVGKEYLIRHQLGKEQVATYTSLRDTIAEKAAALIPGKRKRRPEGPAAKERFWALKDVSFEVKKGECLGIIGRNGAGKSTLLKILSRITEPTKGCIHLKGRVASLLEVGTGFHPELTGRENIFLNGNILGMRRAEIREKFDEIVAFAEVDRFLDTPIKRYSSGMYVRLAFAVASHLEPEILLVDEVLAVGDIAFQKKCLGRMETVTGEGRTVLFVSHNMAVIAGLCNRAILLNAGEIEAEGAADGVVHEYFAAASGGSGAEFRAAGAGQGRGSAATLEAARVFDHDNRSRRTFDLAEAVFLEMEFRVHDPAPHLYVPYFHFFSESGRYTFVSNAGGLEPIGPGLYRATCHIPEGLLNDRTYFVGAALTQSKGDDYEICFFEKSALSFIVTEDIHANPDRYGWGGEMPGVMRPKLEWTIEKFG